jgi:glycosidase
MNTAWIDEAIVYQVNLRALAAREPRNAIEAARERPLKLSPLAYLGQNLRVIRRLGANVLYLMPLYPIGHEQRKGIGSPYAIRDFQAVDAEFGTLAELRALIRRAHALGLKVILDITPNHTSRDHVWTREHPEFYVKASDGSLFFDADWSDTAKLDYRNPALRQAMLDVYQFWLNGADGVDGFRLDMAHFINDLGFWDEVIAGLKATHPERELLFLAECYGTSNNLGLFGRGLNAAYDDDFYKVCLHGYAIDASGQTVVRLAREARNADFAGKREAFERGGIAGAMEAALMSYERWFHDRRGPWLARYTDNHDEGRGLYRFGPGAVRAVNALVFMAPRTLPFLLTGQEYGAENRPSIHVRIGTCEKGRRMVTAAGEKDEAGVESEGNVLARGMTARQDWYAFYRTLIELRRTTLELTRGDFRLLEAGEDCPVAERTVIAFERRLANSVVRGAVNLGASTRRLSKAGLFSGRPLYGRLGRDGHLAPFAAVATRLG